MIELPDAAEARVEGDLGDLQVRVFNQISREMHPVRSRDFNRRRAQMLYEQAAQMARTDTDVIGKAIHIVSIETAVTDKLECPRYYCRCA